MGAPQTIFPPLLKKKDYDFFKQKNGLLPGRLRSALNKNEKILQMSLI